MARTLALYNLGKSNPVQNKTEDLWAKSRMEVRPKLDLIGLNHGLLSRAKSRS